MPPSINNAYPTNFSTGKRYKSKEYKEWTKRADFEVLKQKRYVCSGDERFSVKYQFLSNWENKDKSSKKKDLSNYLKILEDYFKTFIRNFDDRQIWKYESIEKIQSHRDIVIIEIEELPV